MANLLILAALPEEADAVFAGQGQGQGQSGVPHHGNTIRKVALTRHVVRIVTCGLGKVNAAAATALWCERFPPAAVIMTGTCGRLTAVAGDAFWISAAVQHDYGAALASGFVTYPAGDWPMGDASDRPFTAMPDPGVCPSLNLPHARIASGDAFVQCPATTARLTGLGCDLVDMEVAAVAQVAAALGLPWAAIKAPTDDANGDSAGDFHANLLRAAARAAAGVEALVQRL